MTFKPKLLEQTQTKGIKMKILSIALFAIILSGCVTTRIGDFTAISTKNVDIDDYIVLGRFKSDRKGDIKSCVDDCLEKGGGNIIINAVVEFQDRFFTHGYVVKGDVCIKKKDEQ